MSNTNVIKLTKFQATTRSSNFLVNVVSLFLLILGYNGIEFGASSEQIVDAITAGDLGVFIGVLGLDIVNILVKLFRDGLKWSWGFLKSTNFWTQFATVIVVGGTALGIMFPDGTAATVIDAIFGGDFNAILIAIAINVINPLYHFFFDKEETLVAVKPEPLKAAS